MFTSINKNLYYLMTHSSGKTRASGELLKRIFKPQRWLTLMEIPHASIENQTGVARKSGITEFTRVDENNKNLAIVVV